VNTFHYAGQELDLFVHARNWKRYWASQLCPFVRGDVLEVGAGIGSNTALIKTCAAGVRSWTALEPDPTLVNKLEQTLSADPATADCIVRTGITRSIDTSSRFDTLLYIDVLEHIEYDREEMETAANLLRPGGRIVVLSPAHQWLYTPFDEAIGHFRRYNKASLKACAPSGCKMVRLQYLDSVGLLASLGNHFLQQKQPKLSQILFWDRYLVRASKVVDSLFLHSIGKSILAIWRKL